MSGKGIAFQEVEANGSDTWNGIIETIPSANIFHTEEWLFFIKKYFHLGLSRYLILNDGKPAGILPVFVKRPFLFGVAGSPLIAENNPYMGFALKDESLAPLVISSMERFFRRKGIMFLRLSFDNFSFKEQFERNGYELKEKKSFRLDLTIGEEALWGNMEMTCRNKSRKGEKAGCSAIEAHDSSFIEHYYKMSTEVYGRQGLTTLVPKDYYYGIYNELGPKGLLKAYMAFSPDGRPAAGAIVLAYKNKAYYLDGVSFREFSKLAPGNFLQWHIIRTLARQGYSSYDMHGGDMEGIATYKKSFGAVNHPALYAEKSFTPLIKAARNFYAEGKRMKKRIGYLIGGK